MGTSKCCVSFICICVCESFKSESMLCSCKVSVSFTKDTFMRVVSRIRKR